MNAFSKPARVKIFVRIFTCVLAATATQGSRAQDGVTTTRDSAVAHAQVTWRVANNGVDSLDCGTREEPCRSITQAIANAHEGDLVLVGPGRYGDLNDDGNFQPGEDFALDVTKRVTLASTAGAERTVIESLPIENAVAISANGAVFGLPHKGFTVTGGTNGVSVEASADVRVVGNIARGNERGFLVGLGFNHKLTGNVASDNDVGFLVGGIGVRLLENVAVSNGVGFALNNRDTFVSKSAAVSNDTGFEVFGFRHRLHRNSIIGNRHFGVRLFEDQFGTGLGDIRIQQNNIYGNNSVPRDGHLNCGILNASAETIDATHNFWGAATGPGPDPADEACDIGGGQIVVTPFAMNEFRIGTGGGPGSSAAEAAQ